MTDETKKGSADAELIRSVWEEARELIKRLEGTTVQRFAVEAGDTRIEIERGTAPAAGVQAPAPAPSVSAAPAAEGAGLAEAEADGRHPIVAPLVGTFYRAQQPGAKPFVEEGDVVEEKQTVAIGEAMKLMNHVLADQGGRVSEIVAKDGEWVEFEQVLLYLEPLEE